MTVNPDLILWGIIGWAGLLLATVLLLVRTVFRLVAEGTWVTGRQHDRILNELALERERSERLAKAAEIRSDLAEAVNELLRVNVALLAALPKGGPQ